MGFCSSKGRWTRLSEDGHLPASTRRHRLMVLYFWVKPGYRVARNSGSTKHLTNVKHGLQSDETCVMCCQDLETYNHLLASCSFSRTVWFTTLRCFSLQHLTPTSDDGFADWWLRAHKRVMGSGDKLLTHWLFLSRTRTAAA
jgi:hypothetical protein